MWLSHLKLQFQSHVDVAVSCNQAHGVSVTCYRPVMWTCDRGVALRNWCGGGTKSYKMLISTYGCFNNRLLTSYAKTVGLLLWCPTPPGADHESVHPERLHGNATLQRGALPGPRTLREEALGRRRLPPPRPNALPDPASAPRRPAHREWRPLAGRHQRVRPQLRLHVLQRGAVQVGPGC